jgi:hypothetical protein
MGILWGFLFGCGFGLYLFYLLTVLALRKRGIDIEKAADFDELLFIIKKTYFKK